MQAAEPIPTERMLTLREVARILNITDGHAYRLLRDGTFPIHGTQVGSLWRFSPTLVRRYLAGEQ